MFNLPHFDRNREGTLLLDHAKLTLKECTQQAEISYITYMVPVLKKQLMKQIPKTVCKTRLSIHKANALEHRATALLPMLCIAMDYPGLKY